MMMSALSFAGSGVLRFQTPPVVIAATAILIVVLLPAYIDSYLIRLAATVFMYCILA